MASRLRALRPTSRNGEAVTARAGKTAEWVSEFEGRHEVHSPGLQVLSHGLKEECSDQPDRAAENDDEGDRTQPARIECFLGRLGWTKPAI